MCLRRAHISIHPTLYGSSTRLYTPSLLFHCITGPPLPKAGGELCRDSHCLGSGLLAAGMVLGLHATLSGFGCTLGGEFPVSLSQERSAPQLSLLNSSCWITTKAWTHTHTRKHTHTHTHAHTRTHLRKITTEPTPEPEVTVQLDQEPFQLIPAGRRPPLYPQCGIVFAPPNTHTHFDLLLLHRSLLLG